MASIDNNYTAGRGEIWFDQFLPGTLNLSGERYIGNSPAISATFESEALDHFSSDHGINEKDFSMNRSVNRTGAFTTDAIIPENLALFFFGSALKVTTGAATITDEPIPYVMKGRDYQLGVSLSNPTGHRALSAAPAPVVKTGATTRVAGTDYVVDLAMGRLTILEGGAITNGSALTVTYGVTASTRDRIVSGGTEIVGAMRYLAFNPAGKQFDWYMPYVKLSPNGEFSLKTDDGFQEIPFSFEILKKSGLEALYIDGRGVS